MRSVLTRLGCVLVVSLGVAACRDTSGTDTGPGDTGGNDASDVTPQDVVHNDATDTAPPNDVMDGSMGTSLSVQQVANAMATGHPALMSTVSIHGPLVALSTRFVSGPSAHGNCTYSIWVGDPAGGQFSGMEVVESETAPTVDGGAACDLNDTGTIIPNNVAIGDQVTMITGEYDNFCPMGMTCPPGSGAQIFLSHHMGTFAVTSPGTGGPTPPPTTAMITDVNGTTTNAPMDLALQNTLVTIQNAFQQVVPVSGTGGNHSEMSISASMTDTTNELTVVVSSFPNATCIRAALAAAGVGASIGNVTGILNYDFGSWRFQITNRDAITGVTCSDGGTGDAAVDAAVDATVDAASDVPAGG